MSNRERKRLELMSQVKMALMTLVKGSERVTALPPSKTAAGSV
jgi:hypothetical protein